MKQSETYHASEPGTWRIGLVTSQEAASIERLARVTGVLYLVIVVFGMLSPTVLETLVVPGDAVATADNILGSLWLFRISLVGWIVIVVVDVALSATFYVLLERVDRVLSLVTGALRLAYSAVLGSLLPGLYRASLLLTTTGSEGGIEAASLRSSAVAGLEGFGTGFTLALVFFGVHLIGLGVLLHRSGYVPRIFGILLVAAGIGYILDSLGNLFVEDYGGFVTAILLTPAVLGELGLTAWLLMKGVRVRQ